MTRRQAFLLLSSVSIAALTGCSTDSKFKTYNGPEITRVIVFKEQRRMHLMHGDKALKSYDIHLGFAPVGHKQREGDGKTPEGLYRVDRRNPNSRFHLSLGIDYPRAYDVARAKAQGVSPGGDIFIHGRPKRFRNGQDDWTWGCVAVTDREIEDIYAMVKIGTPVAIFP